MSIQRSTNSGVTSTNIRTPDISVGNNTSVHGTFQHATDHSGPAYMNTGVGVSHNFNSGHSGNIGFSRDNAGFSFMSVGATFRF